MYIVYTTYGKSKRKHARIRLIGLSCISKNTEHRHNYRAVGERKPPKISRRGIVFHGETYRILV